MLSHVMMQLLSVAGVELPETGNLVITSIVMFTASLAALKVMMRGLEKRQDEAAKHQDENARQAKEATDSLARHLDDALLTMKKETAEDFREVKERLSRFETLSATISTLQAHDETHRQEVDRLRQQLRRAELKLARADIRVGSLEAIARARGDISGIHALPDLETHEDDES